MINGNINSAHLIEVIEHIPSVHFSRCLVLLFATPWTAEHQAFLSITNSQSLFKLMSIESVMPSNHLTFCHPLLLLPSILPSIRAFSKVSVLLMRCPKYWSFSISPSNKYSGLISFRIDWFDLLAVQGTLKSLLQNHSSKASVLQPSAFFMVKLLQPYMTTGKTMALTKQTFVGKVMSLLFNMLSRLFIAFLPRSKRDRTHLSCLLRWQADSLPLEPPYGIWFSFLMALPYCPSSLCAYATLPHLWSHLCKNN